MKKHIPNILTISRVIIFAPLLVWLTLAQLWTAAFIVFGIGLLTNVLDGYLARRWEVCSKLGADILQPVCDLLFATTAVVLLIVTGHWSSWVGALLLVIAGVLQLISVLAGKMPDNRMVQMLKRHQSYIHPLYSAAVMFVAWFAYLIVENALIGSYLVGGLYWPFLLVTMLALALNYDHVERLVKSSLVRA